MTPSVDLTGARVYRRLMHYVLPYWRAFLLAMVGMVFVAATETAFAALIKPFLDGSFVERDPRIIQWAPIGLIALFLVRGVATYLSTFWMNWVARQVIKTLRAEVFEKLLRLPVSFFDRKFRGGDGCHP
jgi:subfamily B ATP-binding cassette protein MsbA